VQGGETWNLPLYGPEPSPRPQPLDRFAVAGDSVRYKSGDSTRTAALPPGSLYRLRSFTAFDQALLARQLLSMPDRSAKLLPSGTVRLEIAADTTLRLPSGRKHVRLVMLHGRAGSPAAVWLDDKGDLFASDMGWFITVRPEHAAALPALRAIELRYRAAEGEALGKKLAPPPAAALAIVNGDLFDSERGVLLPKTTVVIQGDRIIAVGPAGSVSIPAGATVIDAAGKTVLPGMWDMHTHAFYNSQSSSGPSQLATGITSVRDLAADIDVAVSLRDRSNAGRLATPRYVLAGFMEGPGRWAGPSEVIVSSEPEALAWIARYDSLGYKQIKLYNLIQQDLVPAIAAEAHKRGMRLSGHVPRGLSTPAAVRLGFDEINHAAFLFSTFFPDSLYLPMRAYSAVAATVAPNVDVDGPEMSAMIQLFKEKGTVIDGTFNIWLVGEGPVPNVTGQAPTSNDSIAKRSNANYLRLAKRLFDAGVPLVPGTDGTSYNVELETYERAGIPAAAVLQMATIGSARVMRDDRDYGSVAVGKVADLIVVNGKPTEKISDLRKIEQVVRAGRVYESRALRVALGGN
jgi:imidazolonepropionase-like amidohydrolase